MKQNKYIYLTFELLILAIVLLISFTVLNSEYLFGWVAHNWKFYLILSLVSLLFLLLKKRLVSVFMTIGITTGIFIGNYLGALIKSYNESKIFDGMKAEEIYRLRHHPGFEIWVGIILLFIAIGAIMQIAVKKKENNI